MAIPAEVTLVLLALVAYLLIFAILIYVRPSDD